MSVEREGRSASQVFDLITLGRCSLDLFSQQIGAPFVDIESFETMVGGSPTNIAIGTSRLGLRVAAVTVVGPYLVGDFVRHYLEKEGVITDYVLTKNGRTALAVVGVQPPSNFPLVFYRNDPPEQYLTIDDMKKLPLADTRTVLLVGSNLALPQLRDASLFVARNGRQHGALVVIDLDLRPSLWPYPEAYSQNVQTIFPYCDLVIGTEEEMWAALSGEPELVWDGQSLPESQFEKLDDLVQQMLKRGQVVVLKRGAQGVRLYSSEWNTKDIPGYFVSVLNTVGAGDAFASGLLYGRNMGWEWQNAAQFANACGAIVVTRQGCSTAMPITSEVDLFMENNEVPYEYAFN